MRRLLRLCETGLFVLCVVLVLAALALVPLERSGTLREAVHARLAAALGDAGGGHVELGAADFHWSDPGLRLHDVVLRAGADRSGAGAPTAAGGAPGDELVRLDEVRVRFALFPPRVQRIAALGGVVTAGPALARLEFPAGDDGELPDGGVDDWAELLPQVLVRDVEILVRAADDEPARPLGRLELRVQPNGDGAPRVEGSLTPRLGPPEAVGAPLRFVGAVEPDGGLRVQAVARDVAIASAALPAGLRRTVEGLGAWIATVDVDGDAHFEPGALFPARSVLRARVRDLRGDAVERGPLLADATVDLEATLTAPSAGPVVWARDLGGLAEFAGHWRGAGIDARLAVGADAPVGRAAELQLAVTDLPLDADARAAALDLLEGLPAVRDSAAEILAAIELGGAVDARLGVVLDRRREGVEPPGPRMALVVDPAGKAELTYRGFADRDGVRHGFPVLAREVRGRAVYVHDPARERSDVAALIDLGAIHASGTVAADASIVGPGPGDGPWPRVHLDLVIPAIDVATDLVAGVAGLDVGFDLERAFDPTGGVARGRVLLDQPHERVSPVLAVDLDVEAASASWNELPVPIVDLGGGVRLRWSAETALVEGTEDRDRPARRRAIGIGFDFEGRTTDGALLAVSGAMRDPAIETMTGAERYPAGVHGMLHSESVAVRGATAGGPLVEALTERLPGLGDVLAQIAPDGAADASLTRAIPLRDTAGLLALEVVPDGLRVAPREFLLDDVAGWMRAVAALPPPTGEGELEADGDRIEGVASPARPRPTITAALDARIVAAGADRVALGEPVTVAVDLRSAAAAARATGIELAGPALGDALAEAGIDGVERTLASLAAEGAVDVGLAVRLTDEGVGFDQPRGALHLRRSQFNLGGLPVAGLRGTLRSDGSTVDAPLVHGRIAAMAATLRDGFAGPAADLVRGDPAFAKLLRHVSSADDAERVVGGRIEFDNAEFSPRVLAGFGLGAAAEAGGVERGGASASAAASAAAGAAAADDAWALRLDAEDARFVAALPPGGELAVAVGGSFVPHDVRIGVGLPLTISSAELEVPHAVFEQGRIRALAELREAYGRLGNWSLAGVSSTVSYVEGRLTLDGLRGGFAGGRVGSPDALAPEALPGGRALSVELAPPHRFDLALGFEAIDVGEILAGVVAGGGADRGELRGYLRLTGEPGAPLGLEGSGFVALENARLWSIPVVRELFSQLGFDSTGTFDWMRTRLALRDGELRMTDAVAHSPLLKLVGEGTVGLDGRLDLEFDINYSLVDRLGPLSTLLYLVQSRIFRLSVRGDMTRPRVIVTNPILDLFGRSSRTAPRLPFPTLAEVPPRF